MSPLQCNAPVQTGFYRTSCLRPQGHSGEHLDHAPVCPCERTIDPSTPYGPASPAKIEAGSVQWCHKACAQVWAGERSPKAQVAA